jgi:hypothetical protein
VLFIFPLWNALDLGVPLVERSRSQVCARATSFSLCFSLSRQGRFSFCFLLPLTDISHRGFWPSRPRIRFYSRYFSVGGFFSIFRSPDLDHGLSPCGSRVSMFDLRICY